MDFINEIKKIPIAHSVIIGVACIVSAVLLSGGIATIGGAKNTITTTGSARERVSADTAKLNADITRRVTESDLKIGYARIATDIEKVKIHLKSLGITGSEITIGSVYAGEVWNENRSAPRQYDLRQTVTVQSDDLKKVKSVADSVGVLVNQDVMFQPYAVEYYYSKLPQMRVKLLGSAVADAKSRANAIAETVGDSIGPIRSASSGSVQVVAPNSVNVEDYGSYDTSTIEKDVVVTVRATFAIK